MRAEVETASEGGVSVTLGKAPPQHQSPASLSPQAQTLLEPPLFGRNQLPCPEAPRHSPGYRAEGRAVLTRVNPHIFLNTEMTWFRVYISQRSPPISGIIPCGYALIPGRGIDVGVQPLASGTGTFPTCLSCRISFPVFDLLVPASLHLE